MREKERNTEDRSAMTCNGTPLRHPITGKRKASRRWKLTGDGALASGATDELEGAGLKEGAAESAS